MPIQPSQNVTAASDFTAYNKMSAAYFLIKFIEMRSLLIQLIESQKPQIFEEIYTNGSSCLLLKNRPGCLLCNIKNKIQPVTLKQVYTCKVDLSKVTLVKAAKAFFVPFIWEICILSKMHIL